MRPIATGNEHPGLLRCQVVSSNAPSRLRVRLEGALERLEAAAQTYHALGVALQQPEWSHQLARLDLAALEQTTDQARKALVQRLDEDDLGEGQAALRTLVESRARFRHAVLTRAKELGIAPRGKLGEVIERLRKELPLRYQGEVLAPLERPRSWWLLVAPWLLVVLAQFGGAGHTVLRAFVALSAIFLGAWAFLAVKVTRPRQLVLTVGRRSLALGGLAIPLSAVVSTERRLTSEARNEVTLTIKGRRPISVVTQTDEAGRIEAALGAAARGSD